MDIGKAISAMKAGGRVARGSWDGKTLAILKPGENAKMTLSYIYETSGSGESVPWCASHQELLATDWTEA